MPTKSIVFLVVVLVMFFATGCEDIKSQKEDEKRERDARALIRYIDHDYGNGVYFFPAMYHDDFGKALSNFIVTNPDLQIVAIATDIGGRYANGYWVICKPINTTDVPDRSIPDV